MGDPKADHTSQDTQESQEGLCPHKKQKRCDSCGLCKRCEPGEGRGAESFHIATQPAKRQSLSRNAKPVDYDMSEDAIFAEHDNAVARADQEFAEKQPMPWFRRVLASVGIEPAKLLADRMSMITSDSIDAFKAAAHSIASLVKSIASYITPDEASAKALVDDVGRRLRPDEDVDAIGMSVARAYVRCKPSETALSRVYVGLLLQFCNFSGLAQRALTEALADKDFLERFDQEFIDERRAELNRGSGKKRSSRAPILQPREGRTELRDFSVRHLRGKIAALHRPAQRERAINDWEAVLEGEPPETQFSKCRTPSESFQIALMCIEQGLEHRWRPGSLQNASLEGVLVRGVPYLQRSKRKEDLWSEYEKRAETGDGKIEGFPSLGKRTFYALIDCITKDVEEKACLSYFFTDFLSSQKLLSAICARLRELCASLGFDDFPPAMKEEYLAQGVSVDSLEEMAGLALSFGKYEMYKHFQVDSASCSGCSIHCAAFAVGAQCDRGDHTPKCAECRGFCAIPRIVNQVRNNVWAAVSRKIETPGLASSYLEKAENARKELSSMPAALTYVERCFLLFMQHTARGEWQAKRIEEVIDTVSPSFVVAHFDHRMKQLLRKQYESSEEHFGQSGESVFGICVYFREGSRDEGYRVETRFVDYVVDDNRQSPRQVQGILDCFMRDDLARIVPSAKQVAFLSDNATAFSTFDHLPWVFARNGANWHRTSVQAGDAEALSAPEVKVVRLMYFEAQRGKGLVDCHFSFLGKQVNTAVKLGMVVGPPSTIYDAFILNGGILNTTTVLLGLNVSDGEKKFKPSAALTLGVRRIHDIHIAGADCTAFMMINSKLKCSFQVPSTYSSSVTAPSYDVVKRHISRKEARSRIKKHGSEVAGVTISGEIENKRPFLKSMVQSVAEFAEGKNVPKSLAVPVALLDNEPLLAGKDSPMIEIDDDEVKTTGKKKVGDFQIPLEDDLCRFKHVWTWKTNRARPKLTDAAKARIKQLVSPTQKRRRNHGN